MPKRIIQRSDTVMAEALTDYKDRSVTTAVIAKKHRISTATLTVWAKKAGLDLRRRGRKRQEKPTPRQMEIIKLASVYKYDEVGERMGMAKQSVHRIVKRWRNWAQPYKAPFDPGDLLLWRGKRMIVLEANRTDGTLMEERNGKLYKNFVWTGGRMPKKIGINPRYIKINGEYAAVA